MGIEPITGCLQSTLAALGTFVPALPANLRSSDPGWIGTQSGHALFFGVRARRAGKSAAAGHRSSEDWRLTVFPLAETPKATGVEN